MFDFASPSSKVFDRSTFSGFPVSRESINLTAGVYDYLLKASLREPGVLRRLREEMAPHPQAELQIAPEQGQFMGLLVELIRARKVIEVGVFTGYSSLWMALALPADGRLVACDISEEWTGTARRYWEEAGVQDRVDFRLGPAMDTLDALIASGESGTYDLMFIDADKGGYLGYYERGLRLLRPGGLILVDNVLWSGKLIDEADQDPLTNAIRRFNEALATDKRISLSMLPVGDGLTLAMKR